MSAFGGKADIGLRLLNGCSHHEPQKVVVTQRMKSTNADPCSVSPNGRWPVPMTRSS